MSLLFLCTYIFYVLIFYSTLQRVDLTEGARAVAFRQDSSAPPKPGTCTLFTVSVPTVLHSVYSTVPYSQHWKVESRANIWTTYFSFQLSTGATPTSWWASTCRLSWLTCCGSIWIYQSLKNLHHQATYHNLFAFWRGFSSLFWDLTPCKLGIHRISRWPDNPAFYKFSIHPNTGYTKQAGYPFVEKAGFRA